MDHLELRVGGCGPWRENLGAATWIWTHRCCCSDPLGAQFRAPAMSHADGLDRHRVDLRSLYRVPSSSPLTSQALAPDGPMFLASSIHLWKGKTSGTSCRELQSLETGLSGLPAGPG